jgi:glutathione S-transferase
MKLWSSEDSPFARRVRVYLAEKNIRIPVADVDRDGGPEKTHDYLAANPMDTLPALEFDDGTILPESLAIIEYFEERHPNPPMIGVEPVERARVRALDRLAEFGVLLPVVEIARHGHPHFEAKVKQSPEVVRAARDELAAGTRCLDKLVGAHPFVAGETVTVADCTLYAALKYAERMGVRLGSELPHLREWYTRFVGRRSSSA